jgi:F-type H+-transporting ATPase subunit delta
VSLLSRRYGTALFLAARDQGAVDRVDEDLQRLHRSLQDPELVALLGPATPAHTRLELLQSLISGAHELIVNLVATVNRRRREEILPDIYPDYRALKMEDRGELEGVVETAQPLPELEFRAVQRMAGELTGKQVTLVVRENPDLIGGVRLRVGNTLFDGSVAAALEDLEKQMLRAKIK